MTLSPPPTPGDSTMLSSNRTLADRQLHMQLSDEQLQQTQHQLSPSKNTSTAKITSPTRNANNRHLQQHIQQHIQHPEMDIDAIIETCPDSSSYPRSDYTTTDTSTTSKRHSKEEKCSSFSDESHQQQHSSKISLKFKHSVSTNWIPSMRKKTPQAGNYDTLTAAYPDLEKRIDSAPSSAPSNSTTHSSSATTISTQPIIVQSSKISESMLKTESVAGSNASISTNKTINSKTGFFPKASKRISLAPASLIPKRFSTSHQAPVTQPATASSIQMDNTSRPVTTSSEFSATDGNATTPSPNVNSDSPGIPPLSPNKSMNPVIHIPTSPSLGFQTAPYRQVLNRNTSFSSSTTPSEKSTIGKSLNAFKRTTKSILFLESSSTNSQISSSYNNNNISDYQQMFLNPIDNMTMIRRSKSYTESDRREAISFAMLEDTPEITRRHVLSDSEDVIEYSENIDDEDLYNTTQQANDTIDCQITFDNASMIKNTTLINNSRDKRQLDSNVAKSRQRSKTIDVSDNPLLELTNNGNNTGILSSIANFVKINRTSSSASSINKLNHNHENLPKIDHLETIENETPADFLSRLLKIYPLTFIGELLSSEDNDFLKKTLQEYLSQYYDFSNEPLDMALRKFLMLNHLPKETQQIDRFIYQFAKYYHCQHLELGLDQDSLYILTYSLIMVHTDKFNPNNKKKMSRFEFVQNVLNALENNLTESTSNSNELPNLILKESLGYFFDNITYCPLIKISPEQSGFALDALKSKTIPLPYPNMSFLSSASTGRTSDYDYRKSSITSTASIPSTAASIHRSNSQQVLQAQPPLRKKSSSFLWTTPSTTDPYEYIVKNEKDSLNDLKLLANEKNIHLTCQNPFILPSAIEPSNPLDDDIPSIDMINKQLDEYSEQMDIDIKADLLCKIWKSLTKSQIDFTLKVPKNKGLYLVSDKVNVIPLNDSHGEEFYLTRVVKVGLIDRQEVTTSASSSSQNESTATPIVKPNLTDISTMEEKNAASASGNKNKSTVWKRYFCILTVVGMFFFKDVSSFRMRFCGKNEIDGTKMVIIEEASKSKLLNSFTEAFGMASNNIHSTINSPNLSTDSTSFITFPHFRSDKNDNKLDKDKSHQLIPSFVLGGESFATRKLQNIEYDNVVNEISNSPRMSPSQSIMSENSTNLPSTSPHSLSSPRGSNAQSFTPTIPQVYISEEHAVDTSYDIDEPRKVAKPTNKTLKYTFFIYGKMSKNIYMVSTLVELQSWIYSINIMNTLAGVKIDYDPLDCSIIPKEITTRKFSKTLSEPKYYEIVPIYNISIEQRFMHRTSNELSDYIGSNDNMDDLISGEYQEDLKDDRRRNRSNTTLLSKITPSIPNIGLGLNPSFNKSENEKKAKTTDGMSDTLSSLSNEIEQNTTSSRAVSSSDGDRVEVDFSNTDSKRVIIREVNDLSKRLTNQLELVKELTETEFERDLGAVIEGDPTKVLSTNSSTPSSLLHLHLLEHLYSVKRLLNTMPLQKKTKDDLLSTAKILSIKLEWLWFEKCRSRTIAMISKRIMKLNSTTTSVKQS